MRIIFQGSGNGTGVGEERAEPVSINELLLRGCALRNTAWVVGLVVFTGADTKIVLNGGDTPSKRSKVRSSFIIIMSFITSPTDENKTDRARDEL